MALSNGSLASVEAWIIDTVRIPHGFGRAEGAVANVHPHRLLGQLLRALIDRTGLDPADIDDVITGISAKQGKQGPNLSRMAVLEAGLPLQAPGFSLDRFCGSGLTAMSLATMGILSGMQEVLMAGGVEMMSHTRTLSREFMMDSGNLSLRDKIPQPHQGCALI